MKTFFKAIIGGAVGAIIGIFFIATFIAGSFMGLFDFDPAKSSIDNDKKTLLRITLDRSLVEVDRPQFSFLSEDFGLFDQTSSINIHKLAKTIREAAKDPNIKGLVLYFEEFHAGLANLESLGRELQNFQKTKKPLWVFSDSLDEKSLYLASNATSISMPPWADIQWIGLSLQHLFVKKFLDNWGVKPRIFRSGKFKAAVEPFMLEHMSEENRQESTETITDFWNNLLQVVGQNRSIKSEKLQEMANNLSLEKIEDALHYKMIDKIETRQEFDERVKKEFKIENDKDHKWSTDKLLSEYSFNYRSYYKKIAKKEAEKEKKQDKNNLIGLVVIEGEIVFGWGSKVKNKVGHREIIEQIDGLLGEENLKAIVVRVNSGGGSATASELMWQALQHASKKVPIYASFGDYAASGGYYLAAGAKEIWAENNTLTGSIGVFALSFEFEKLFSEKLGIHADQVKSAAHADLGNVFRELTDQENNFIQKQVDRTYQRFLSVVQTGRKFKNRSEVDSLAQGYIYSGKRALKLKLVDKIGSLSQCVQALSNSLKLGDDYVVKSYSAKLGPFQEFLHLFEDESTQWMNFLKSKKISAQIYTRLPFGFEF